MGVDPAFGLGGADTLFCEFRLRDGCRLLGLSGLCGLLLVVGFHACSPGSRSGHLYGLLGARRQILFDELFFPDGQLEGQLRIFQVKGVKQIAARTANGPSRLSGRALGTGFLENTQIDALAQDRRLLDRVLTR